MNDNGESVKTCSFLSKADIFKMKIPFNQNDFNVTVYYGTIYTYTITHFRLEKITRFATFRAFGYI